MTAILRNGYQMPLVGLGTFRMANSDAAHIVKDALDIGYRLIDTATIYRNEEGVGCGVKSWLEQGNKREDVFITSKLSTRFRIPGVNTLISTVDPREHGEKAEAAFNASLARLGVDYIVRRVSFCI